MLPNSVAPDQTIITITGDTAVDLSRTRHSVAIESGGQRFKAGDQIILISKATADAMDLPVQLDTELKQGHFIIYNTDMEIDDVDGDDAFVLKFKGDNDGDEAGHINPRTKALLEGRAAALGFLSQGSDLIATAGIDNIRVMQRKNDNARRHIPFLPFLITKGGFQPL